MGYETPRKDIIGYEVEFEGLFERKLMIEDYLLLLDLRQRRLFLDDDVDSSTVIPILDHILRYNDEDDAREANLARYYDAHSNMKKTEPPKREPIRLYIASGGGSVVDGLGLCDVIKHSKTPVYTIAIGYAYSMALPILMAGHKRFATPNASFLIHDGSNNLFGSASKTEDTLDFTKRCDERVKQYILENSRISEEALETNRRKEWYLFANEAKELGVVDYLIGIDCSFDVLSV